MWVRAFHPDEYLLVAVNQVIVTDGVTRLTLRRVAEAMNYLSPSTLVSQYGSRERMLVAAAYEMARARSSWHSNRCAYDGPDGFLPADDDGVLGVRAWLGWLELWRSEDFLAAALQQARDEDLRILDRAVEHQLDREPLRMVMATIDGLCAAVADPVQPMRPATAHAILGRLLRGLGVDPRG